MEIVDTMANEVQAVRRTRREYSAELKTQVVQACRQPGASVASVAMAHGINANIVHRWLREPSRALGVVTVNWPLDGAAACAQWLRDWLK
jgi:transposase